mmetsp:Transcript_15537/g.33637  ORF Transcript_15537/g.33637 Transcript_15537/m.33637 type:complete len:578 (+) Transcript_15537:1685-3418(+)|eukprot:CAMPEP_0172329276 /NCGR_PEP_ID=MMETSP1058-20130122/60796_1 /TAXON_ID=83371 /ORGANISM="Detonula confervacea, Strain CCMP 353" /LENGTH=577 /DNA_ID=CAMNT_0013046447 /DNA_START=1569 /DNA_END=3302 /DNA_ORIENTATION=-
MNKLHLISLLRLAVHEATGFGSPYMCRKSFCNHRSFRRLQDSLFGGLFESNNDNNKFQLDALPPENYNDDAPPFSESESPQDRVRRMSMARELQKMYYKEPPLIQQLRTSNPNNIPYGSTVLRNLPTITNHDGINGADESSLLPGFQFIWNIHNPQHCHMFHSILSGPAPWYFAHVYLPSSSTLSEFQKELKQSDSPLYGTLFRITDRSFEDEDGSIILAVQAIDRIRVHNVASVPGTYLSTDVQLSPEEELIRLYFDKALMSSASCISSDSDAADIDSALSGAARAAAVADTSRVRKFEYLPIFLEEKPKIPSSAVSLRSNPNESDATKKTKDDSEKKESGQGYISVVQLCNYDAFEFSSLGNTDSVTSQALKTYWEHLAKESSPKDMSTEDDLFDGHGSDSSSSFFLPEPAPPSSSPHGVSVEAVEMIEFHVWRTLDEMIRLLSMAASATVPLPSQLLGLLPKRNDWPNEFALEDYAKSLSTSRSTVGTSFKSPFVRVDQITSTNPSSYSPLRRAQRLSFAIWILLDGLAMTGAQPQPPRNVILGMESIEERLSAAKETLDDINAILKKLLSDPK